ncbi:MAG: HNH endonuclease [Chloroflexota bacterium]
MTYIPDDLRLQVRKRANYRCEYCRMPEGYSFHIHEIDHIYAEKHGGETIESNLCLSCWVCNRHKGTDLTSFDPDTGVITPLFHPRNHRWENHFRLSGAIIESLSATGRTTITLLQLNRRERVDERQILISLGQYP